MTSGSAVVPRGTIKKLEETRDCALGTVPGSQSAERSGMLQPRFRTLFMHSSGKTRRSPARPGTSHNGRLLYYCTIPYDCICVQVQYEVPMIDLIDLAIIYIARRYSTSRLSYSYCTVLYCTVLLILPSQGNLSRKSYPLAPGYLLLVPTGEPGEVRAGVYE